MKLTAGEKLFVVRKRHDLNQKRMAKIYKVSPHKYGLWERDQVDEKDIPKAKRLVNKLKKFEVCFILRRRDNLTQEKLATELFCSRWWIIQMENGTIDCDPLYSHWKKFRSF